MGQELECVARYQGRTSSGRAHLEGRELLFRGDFRVKMPLDANTKVSSRGGRLRVASGDDVIELDLDSGTARDWAERIKNPKSRIDRLGVKPGATVAVIRMPDADLLDELKAAGAKLLKTPRDGVDVVFLRARAAGDLSELARLERLIARTGAIWVVYPKGIQAIRQADVMSTAKSAGLVTIKVTAFSDTESALKLVIPAARR